MISSEIKKTSIDLIKTNSDKILSCLDHFDDEEIWKDFSPVLVSTGNLVLHLIGNVSQYIISGLGNNPYKRERDKEFSGKPGYTREQLKANFISTINKATQVIESLDTEKLMEVYSIQGKNITGMYSLVHAAEHLSYHTGQIIWVLKYFKNITPDYYKDEDLNRQNVQ